MEEVRKAVQAGVEAKGEEWDEDDWEGFVQEAALWLLEEKGKKNKWVVSAAVGLILYGATTEEDLQLVADSKEEFKRQLTAKGVLDAICDLLFAKYVAKKGKKRAGSGDVDLRPVKRRLVGKKDKFFASLLDAKVSATTYGFSVPIVDSIEQTALFVRPCYAPMHNQLLTISKQREGAEQRRLYAGAIVTGTSGIGKTFMSCYTIHRLVKEELCTVVYNFRNKNRYVLAPPRVELEKLPDGDARRAILSFREFDESGLLEGESDADREKSYWWGEINMRSEAGEELYTRLKDLPGLWLIVDLHEEKYDDERNSCNIVLFSSLRTDKFKGFAGGGGGSVPLLYMPVWTLDEAEKCVEALPQLSMSKETVAGRFKEFGGSARMLFNKGNSQKTIDDQLRRVNARNLESALDPSGTDPTLSSYLVHAKCNSEFELTGRKFASVEIAQQLLSRLVQSQNFNTRVWPKAIQGERELAGARAVYAEQLWHHYVQAGGKRPVALKVLGTGLTKKEGESVEQVTLHAKFARTKVFSSMAMDDLHGLAVGDYALPMISNFPAVDAFGVVEGALWGPSSSPAASDANVTLIMFQMTISLTHPPIAHHIAFVINKVKALLPTRKKLTRVVLAFVVEDCAGFGFQQFIQAKKAQYKRWPKDLQTTLSSVEQVALQFL
uniref:Uncharacterized protein n=1 Tax=Mucochytrium quahogii TaxID=96639 RepID=A0A7S2SGY0_9STRA|mmetsp:Transcript_30586/g.49011  ORF Transcript_30586/g.49011 Transcript_30586/m.49011 type:complete len:665 (+) Transcript_30586:223-2217(+)|eukprot:CAMPEP_0203748992 /NCGR_PEP_ID=MMETSP0098-20131031/3709_1 /ASSEMBLY_ACC=CAM_ASM_000208 /TAXON_ID=96639 /ORGANISM=" , Strain NY0313808BC1" /LENGTH=664 /DNA_ID=CAMNT_0050637919 /DNA_START=180 /DNA_END=2174 /DNA_ORIENTATION=+